MPSPDIASSILTRRRFLLRAGAFASFASGRLRSGAAAWQPTTPPASTPIQLVNGASHAGLDFVLRNGAAGRKYQVETVTGGLGVIDFDNDGWPDLFCTNGASLPYARKVRPILLEPALSQQS